jgi:hypothetical protein
MCEEILQSLPFLVAMNMVTVHFGERLVSIRLMLSLDGGHRDLKNSQRMHRFGHNVAVPDRAASVIYDSYSRLQGLLLSGRAGLPDSLVTAAEK